MIVLLMVERAVIAQIQTHQIGSQVDIVLIMYNHVKMLQNGMHVLSP
jgi:hypothetical protein